MSSIKSNLEIQGAFAEHPFAELLVEAAHAKLSGSFRLSHEAEKTIVYVKNGEVIFAVSNARKHRLFEQLLQSGKISRDDLAQIPNFANDLEFSRTLVEKEIIAPSEIEAVFCRIIEDILENVCNYKEGDWIFSPLAQVRAAIAFKIETAKVLMTHARNCQPEFITQRFRSFEESFEAIGELAEHNLSPHEGFIFSRFENQSLTINDVRILSGLPDAEILKSLYILWLGGLIKRRRWNSAFTENQIHALKTARLTLKKEETVPVAPKRETVSASLPESAETIENTPPDNTETPEIIETPLSVEDYLANVEAAVTHYESLNVAHDAPLADIKTAYFKLAKNFHPDKYHQESDLNLQQRIQHAFTEIAKAYETLKTEESRQVYDFKLRKYLEELGATQKPAQKEEPLSPAKTQSNEEKAKEEFDRGFNFLMNQDYTQAMPYLLRAVHLAPQNARYHAYYGKVISVDEKQRFKADAEFQTAIRLEPDNPTFRIMLAEFYIHYNLLKRAEGELHRLLAIAPDNKEAKSILDSLAKK